MSMIYVRGRRYLLYPRLSLYIHLKNPDLYIPSIHPFLIISPDAASSPRDLSNHPIQQNQTPTTTPVKPPHPQPHPRPAKTPLSLASELPATVFTAPTVPVNVPIPILPTAGLGPWLGTLANVCVNTTCTEPIQTVVTGEIWPGEIDGGWAAAGPRPPPTPTTGGTGAAGGAGWGATAGGGTGAAGGAGWGAPATGGTGAAGWGAGAAPATGGTTAAGGAAGAGSGRWGSRSSRFGSTFKFEFVCGEGREVKGGGGGKSSTIGSAGGREVCVGNARSADEGCGEGSTRIGVSVGRIVVMAIQPEGNSERTSAGRRRNEMLRRRMLVNMSLKSGCCGPGLSSNSLYETV